MKRVIDHWTTRDGHWYLANEEYGIDQEHLDRYANEDIPPKGSATHIIMKAPVGSVISIQNRYNNEIVKNIPVTAEKPWVDFPMNKDAAYKPERGETGPWNVLVDGAIVAGGIGLPHSWHVSQFLVIGEEGSPEVPDEGPEIPEQPTEKDLRMEFSISANGYAAIVQLYTDGTYYLNENRG